MTRRVPRRCSRSSAVRADERPPPRAGSPPLIPLPCLERSPAACSDNAAGNPPALLELKRMKYSTRSLSHRSHSGQLVSPPDTFSTDFVLDAAVGLQSVPDADIVAAAFRILAKRVAHGSLIKNMEAAKQYLMLRFGELEHEVFAVLYLTARHR